MPIGTPKSITECQRFFIEPSGPRHRMYEALRALFVDGHPSSDVAEAFGYTPGSFRVLCHQFRRDPQPEFFVSPKRGPQTQPKKSAARAWIIELRKKNHSVYEISEELRERGLRLSPTAVREVLSEEGFAALPRRLDEERPERVGPTVESVADARAFSLEQRRFTTQFGGLFLFLPDLVRLNLDKVARKARLPGSRMIPIGHAMRASLATKLWCIERKSHVMSLLADEGLPFACGLNTMAKKSYLSEYSSRIDHAMTTKLLVAWHELLGNEGHFSKGSFNLDFHSVPYHGEHPVVQKHFVSKRSRRQRSVLVMLAQDAEERAFCYSNADLRKGEESEEVIRFVKYWKRVRGEKPKELVFDSQFTTQKKLLHLDDMGIHFITLRRRYPKALEEVEEIPRSAWRRIELDVPTRKFKTPRVYGKTVKILGRSFRQLYVLDLGHDEPTVLLTNERSRPATKLITRYAQRMIIENVISDSVRFFHMDALSSAVALKADFDMALLVIASTLYRMLARRMRGYADAEARTIFRDLIDIPADVVVGDGAVDVRFHRRSHLPIIMASGLLNKPTPIPWWGGTPLRLTAEQ
jgi:transposase